MDMLPMPQSTPVGQSWDAQHGMLNKGLGVLGGLDLGSIFGGLFGGGHYNNPSDAAMPYLNQISGQVGQYMNPYVKAGQNALGTLQGEYGKLLNDPSQMLANFGKNFQQDPGYQYNLKQGENAITNAAAAGGMAGTPMHQHQAGDLAENMANQQYQNYLQNVMGLYGQGLGGYQGLNQMGFQGSQDMAQALSQALMQQANLAYMGQENKNKQEADKSGGFWNSIGSLVGGAAKMFI